MPELPEVETIVRELQAILAGQRVEKAKILDPLVMDRKIADMAPFFVHSVSRRGKYIVFTLDNEKFILCHLRMTGHFHHVRDDSEEHKKYCCGLLYLQDGTVLSHNSIRRFGRMKVVTAQELKETFSSQGMEPLEMTLSDFVRRINDFPHAVIKTKLMDQRFVAGVGNIYAQEALYRAGIHPSRRVGEVSSRTLARLHAQLQEILYLAIQCNGTTVHNYNSIDGKGNFQHLLAVYGKQNCPQGHPVTRTAQSGRGTYFCGKCQR